MNLANIDLNLIPTFVAVAEAGSFSEAARKLGVPPSTVSRAVASLERALGVQLLARTTRHVALTPEGNVLRGNAMPALLAMQAALGSVPDGGEPSGVLRITAAPDIGATFLAETVCRFNRRYPAVRVEVSISNRHVELTKEGFDAAVRATAAPLKDSSLVVRKLGPLDFCVFASPGYLARRGVPRRPQDVAQHDWVEFRGWKHARELAASLASPRIVCDDFAFMREALREGAGLGFLPTFLARPAVATGQLVQVLPGLCKSGGRLVLLHPNTLQPSSRLIAFRDFLLEVFAGYRLT